MDLACQTFVHCDFTLLSYTPGKTLEKTFDIIFFMIILESEQWSYLLFYQVFTHSGIDIKARLFQMS